MINGLHTIIFAKDAEATRAFFRDVLGLRSVDAGGGWLIFAMPPAELGIHPTGDEVPNSEHGRHRLYLMCDDIQKTMAELKTKGVEFTKPVEDEGWGLHTMFKVPGGGEMSLYQARHATAIGAASAR